jgi:hypothetical protein
MKRAKPTLDDRPGPTPDVHTTVHGVTYVMAPCGTDTSARLVIRCDERGGMWVSLGVDRQAER